MEAYIKLKKDEDILRFKIQDENGNDTGETLEFDLMDLNLFDRYNELIYKDKKAREKLQADMIRIEKMKSTKGKNVISEKNEATIKAYKEFFKEEEVVYNLFLGENGVKKLLNGRALGLTTLAEIDGIIEEYIMPKLENNVKNIKKHIAEKYKIKKDDIIE